VRAGAQEEGSGGVARATPHKPFFEHSARSESIAGRSRSLTPRCRASSLTFSARMPVPPIHAWRYSVSADAGSEAPNTGYVLIAVRPVG
jgi:hypothetical protein